MKPKICYLDCTETVTYNNNTGIQRCVRNILSRLITVRERYEVVVCPVIAIMGNYYQYDINKNAKTVNALSAVFGTIKNILDFLLPRFRRAPVIAIEPAGTVHAGNYVDFIQLCRKIMPLFYWVAYQIDGVLVTRKSIRFEDNDILFIADAFWNEHSLLALTNCQSKKIYLLLYDVIPLMAPHLCDDSHVYNFKSNFTKIISRLAGIFTISRSEMVNVESYCRSISKDTRYDYFYLGADFVDNSGENTINSTLEEVFRHGNVYIIVGTIEPRKNHSCVLDAFETLWQQGLDVTLCIIGKIGWKSTDIVSRINHNSQFGKKLFMLNGITDQELAYCYLKCSGVIFASLAEGFGLPLVEGMHCGRPVLASDIPVFHEIGGDYPAFFSPHDPLQLVNLVAQIEKGEIRLPTPRSWITWDASVEMLFERLFSITDSDVTVNQGEEV